MSEAGPVTGQYQRPVGRDRGLSTRALAESSTELSERLSQT